MKALGLADLLIVPAGGVVDGARRVDVCDLLGYTSCIKLPPAFVKGHPHGDARAVVQKLDHLVELGLVFYSALEVLSCEKLVVFIAQVYSGNERRGDDCRIVAAAAVYHVLPDEHAEPVAVIVPAQGLNLDVFAQHVKAHVLRRLDIEDECLIGRGGVHSVGPVALVEQTVVEIGLAV